MNDRKPWENRPPLDPPPEDVIRLYVRWQAAREHRVELERTLSPVGEAVAGGVVIPIHNPRVLDAARVESAAGLAFYRHEWWFRAFSKSEAERVIEVAARGFGNAGS